MMTSPSRTDSGVIVWKDGERRLFWRVIGLALLLVAFLTGCSRAPEETATLPTSAPAATATLLPPTSTPSPTIGGPEPTSGILDFDAVDSRTATSSMVVGTSGERAISAGQQILAQGGSAADAALATALAQTPLMLGNFISYAGIMEFLYYDSASGQIYSLNAGWDVPRGETDPLSIPRTPYPYRGGNQPSGRTALVPGFMAGVEAAHERFGRLPFAEVVAPAIEFAREGVVVDAMQAGFMAEFEPVIGRLPETRSLFTREDGQLYQIGDRYRQPLLADLLESVAAEGAAYMYTGPWGQAFVETVQQEGGTITLDDMAAYQVQWSEAVSTTYGNKEVYSAGLPVLGGVTLIEGINLIEAADLAAYGHFTREPEALFWMMQITRASVLSALTPEQQALVYPDLDLSPETRLTKESATRLWDHLQAGDLPIFTPEQRPPSTHSAAVVAVDESGNIAALTHTSNSYLYGGSGISVEGVYIPDPGSYQQATIAAAGAGNRVPSPINPVIVLQDGQPIWASSAIGQVSYETLQRLASVLVYGEDLVSAQKAPTLLSPRIEEIASPAIEQVFPDSFDPALIEGVRLLGQPVEEIPLTFETFVMGRGILAAITIDPQTGQMTGAVPSALGGAVAGE